MLTILVPVYNEENNLQQLHDRLSEVLSAIGDYEVIFVDDGSTDRSFEVLRSIRAKDDRVKLIKFRRNFGQQAALAAGFDHSKGDFVVTIDADLQYDPADIMKFYKEFKEGYDYVSGWRKGRKDPFLKRRLPSMLVNVLARRLTGVPLHDIPCPIRGYSKGIVEQMKDFSEMRRCAPMLGAKLCKNPAEVDVGHSHREGQSKYGLWGLVRVYFDFYISFSVRPFQALTVVGLGVLALTVLSSLIYTGLRLFDIIRPIPPVLYLILLAGTTSIQLIILGILGEYIIRVYRIVQDRSLYNIENIE